MRSNLSRPFRLYLKIRTWVLPQLKCPGLYPGWFIAGDRETWYSRRPCEVYMNPIRMAYVGVCRDCSAAFNRRGFRLNYAVKP